MTRQNGDRDVVDPPRRTFCGLSPRQRRLLQASARARTVASSSSSSSSLLSTASLLTNRGASAAFISKLATHDTSNNVRMVNEKEEREIMTIKGGCITADDKCLPSSLPVGGKSGASTAALTDSTTMLSTMASSSSEIGRTTTSNLRRHYEIITSETNIKNFGETGIATAAGEEIRGRGSSGSLDDRMRTLNKNNSNIGYNMRINNHHNGSGERLTTLTMDRPSCASSRDQQQLFDCNKTHSSLNDIDNDNKNGINHDNNGAVMRYYKIIFQGVVSLLSDINDYAKLPLHNESNSSGIYLSYGEIVATSVPEIIISLNNYYSTDDDDDDDDHHHTKQSQTVMMFIRVDSILTGGYATDAVAMASQLEESGTINSQYNVSGINCLNINEVGDCCNDSAAKSQCYGYLPLFVNGRSTSDRRPIAVPMLMAASECIHSSCELGSFLYRVIARTPVAVLSGPSIDAVQLGMGLMPGSVHEVSLRFTVPLSLLNDNNHYIRKTSLIETDAEASDLKFLRLGKRRGWVVDRSIDSTDNKLRSAYLMQDMTNERESTLSISFEESSSIPSSAITSVADTSFYSSAHASSVATPTTVKLQRRRNRRQPRAGGGMDSTQSLQLLKLVQENKRVGESFEEASSITGDVSNVSIISGEGDQISFAHAQHRPNRNFYLMRVLAPSGLKIMDAPHFQVRVCYFPFDVKY